MRLALALLLFFPGAAPAATLKTIACWKTNITTPIVSICQGELDQKPIYSLLTIDGDTTTYEAAPRSLIGNDPVFGTSKFRVPLALLGKSNGDGSFSESSMPKSATLYVGTNTSTGGVVYLQGSSEIDFLIDLRR